MAREPSKILTVAEAAVGDLEKKIIAQEKVAEKAKVAYEKEVAKVVKLLERKTKADAKKVKKSTKKEVINDTVSACDGGLGDAVAGTECSNP